MRIAYLDTFAEIAGDMVLGAFVSAGIDLKKLRAEIAKLDLGKVDLETGKVVRSGITAIKVDVVVSGEVESVNDLGGDIHRHSHGDDSHHHHGKGHEHDESTHSHGHGRSYLEIRSLIESAPLSENVKGKSKEIFGRIAEAEAKIHDTTVEKIHFHEVGAVDSIVDIVGTAVCLEIAGVEGVYTSPVRLGSNGYVEAQHGVLPVPAPATLEILKGYPAVFNDVPHELTTPTGAAIVAALSRGVLKETPVEVERIGYGAGTKDLGRLPNLLRVVIGDIKSPTEEDHVLLVETNMDDINPQLIPHLIERVLAEGATDAYVTPVMMKKGRPGFVFTVLMAEPLLERISKEIFAQSTTLGLRIQTIRRSKLHRELSTARTSYGDVRVKETSVDGKKRVTVEFDECKRIAEERGIPLRDILERINAELNRD
jgi:hypothetical protein